MPPAVPPLNRATPVPSPVMSTAFTLLVSAEGTSDGMVPSNVLKVPIWLIVSGEFSAAPKAEMPNRSRSVVLRTACPAVPEVPRFHAQMTEPPPAMKASVLVMVAVGTLLREGELPSRLAREKPPDKSAGSPKSRLVQGRKSVSVGRAVTATSHTCFLIMSDTVPETRVAIFGLLACGQMTKRVRSRLWFVAPRRLRPTLPVPFSRPTTRSAVAEAGPRRMRISMRPEVSKRTIWNEAEPARFFVGTASHSTVSVRLGAEPCVRVVMVPPAVGSRSVQKPAMKSSRLAVEGIVVATTPVSAPGEVKASWPLEPMKKLVLATPKKEKANGSSCAALNSSGAREKLVAARFPAMLS